MSHSDAMTAMRGGRGGRGDILNITINTPINLADRAFVEQEMAPVIRNIMRRERA